MHPGVLGFGFFPTVGATLEAIIPQYQVYGRNGMVAIVWVRSNLGRPPGQYMQFTVGRIAAVSSVASAERVSTTVTINRNV